MTRLSALIVDVLVSFDLRGGLRTDAAQLAIMYDPSRRLIDLDQLMRESRMPKDRRRSWTTAYEQECAREKAGCCAGFFRR